MRIGIVASSVQVQESGGDVTPDAVNWGYIDTTGTVDSPIYTWSTQLITGIDTSITLKISSSAIPGTDIVYNVSNVEHTMVSGGNIIADGGTFSVNNGQWVQFYINSGSGGIGSTTVSILNNGDGDAVLDSFVASYDVSGCYLTTTIVRVKKLQDNGPELSAMRKLRERYATRGYYGPLISEYIQVSPHIVSGIEKSSESELYYDRIHDVVNVVASLVEADRWDDAATIYTKMYLELKDQFYTK